MSINIAFHIDITGDHIENNHFIGLENLLLLQYLIKFSFKHSFFSSVYIYIYIYIHTVYIYIYTYCIYITNCHT
jgi:hypothetical protein